MQFIFADKLPKRAKRKKFMVGDLPEKLSDLKATNQKYIKVIDTENVYDTPMKLYHAFYQVVYDDDNFKNIFKIALINGETWIIRTDL